MQTMNQPPAVVGCWRAHMNVYERMMRERVSSALIFEDDADWDVALRAQLVQFDRGSRYVLNIHDEERPSSPYGSGWDLLWLGHCGSTEYPGNTQRYFVIPHDPTVAPPEFRLNYKFPDVSRWEHADHQQTRMVFRSGEGACTTAYGLSLQGAMKANFYLNQPNNLPIDLGLGKLCQEEAYHFTCVSAFPSIIGIARPEGISSRWSDISSDRTSTGAVAQASSQSLVYSTWLNLPRLIEGGNVDSQYPDVESPHAAVADIERAVSHAEVIEFPGES